ncbi:hypothetical protein SPSIL_008660 [Sporomusa silvacetica DSM 10669]|uniref:LysM domain-containing protein n=1 Tax=Sporomusa silvacetica DSM 10669 TaxID=1123289 RepID=A0ABZ3IGE9_9FIRM|nr:LysM domain-containing protein [Sporomusa silvacetica]OZC13174.1 hypothetical protein SPSIL_56300 [Sporomusa silvacetica DSM 10669]
MKRLIVVACLFGLVAVSCGNADQTKGHLESEVYVVKSGDTLDTISYKFMEKSSVRRDVREFREGIIELNYDMVFAVRYPHELIMPGDKLTTNYWVAKEEIK